jgi:hypothetical protein
MPKKKLLTAVCFLALFAYPRSALSCPACWASWMNLAFPFVYEAIVVLFIWRIIYGIEQLKLTSVSKREIASGVAIRLVATVIASCFFGISGVLLYFTLSFIKALIRLLDDTLKSAEQKHFYRKAVMHSIAGVLLIPLIVYGYHRQSQMDALDKIQKYVSGGTIPERYLIEKYIASADFNLERVKDLIVSSDVNDRNLGFNILWQRKSPEDLIGLKEVVLGHSQLEEALSSNFRANAMYFGYWLLGVGVDEAVDSKEDFRAWLDDLEDK